MCSMLGKILSFYGNEFPVSCCINRKYYLVSGSVSIGYRSYAIFLYIRLSNHIPERKSVDYTFFLKTKT